MDYLVHIDDTADYSLSEFLDVLREVLSKMDEEAPDNMDVAFPGKEVFFTVRDLVEWINGRLPGNFIVKQEKSRQYSFVYHHKKREVQREQSRKNKSLADSALAIMDITGKLPAWAEKPEIKRHLSGHQFPVESDESVPPKTDEDPIFMDLTE